MVLYSSRRRHRLEGIELAPVMRLVRRELERITHERENIFDAKILFRTLWRFETNKWGRPSYPFDKDTPDSEVWEIIEDFIKGPLTRLEQPTEQPIEAIAKEGE